MSQVLDPTARRQRPTTRPLAALALAVVALVAFVLTNWSTREPGRVARLVIDNPHQTDVDVHVSAAGDRSHLAIGRAKHTQRTTFEEVLDQGQVWVVRFSSAWVSGGEVVVRRTALDLEDWTVRVPDSVAEQLRAAGLGPSA
jgi:hypothetical protein